MWRRVRSGGIDGWRGEMVMEWWKEREKDLDRLRVSKVWTSGRKPGVVGERLKGRSGKRIRE